MDSCYSHGHLNWPFLLCHYTNFTYDRKSKTTRNSLWTNGDDAKFSFRGLSFNNWSHQIVSWRQRPWRLSPGNFIPILAKLSVPWNEPDYKVSRPCFWQLHRRKRFQKAIYKRSVKRRLRREMIFYMLL